MKKLTATLYILCLFGAVAAEAATVTLPRTGQTTCADAAGNIIACTGTGQDGDKQKGAAWPSPRFTDNANGTVTDNLTGLIWLKNANCTDTVGGITKGSGYLAWANALSWSNALSSGACGLSDGSTAGQWRLPNITELESLVDAEHYNPALPAGHPFTGVLLSVYWSSSSHAGNTSVAWFVGMNDGVVVLDNKTNGNFVWPVRAGQ